MLIAFFQNSSVIHNIDNQNIRNSYLSNQIVLLNKKNEEINTLKVVRDQLIERMRVIQELQGNRPVIVHIFDELARSLSADSYYKRLTRSGNKLFIQGRSKSNNQISDLMRRLDDSEWFTEPNLTDVRAIEASNGYNANDFNITVKQIINTDVVGVNDS